MTAADQNGHPARPLLESAILRVVCAYAAAFVVFGFVVDGPGPALRGLAEIVTTRDALLTDYFGIGGIGGACVNAGLLMLCAGFVYHRAGAKITGAAVACLRSRNGAVTAASRMRRTDGRAWTGAHT